MAGVNDINPTSDDDKYLIEIDGDILKECVGCPAALACTAIAKAWSGSRDSLASDMIASVVGIIVKFGVGVIAKKAGTQCFNKGIKFNVQCCCKTTCRNPISNIQLQE